MFLYRFLANQPFLGETLFPADYPAITQRITEVSLQECHPQAAAPYLATKNYPIVFVFKAFSVFDEHEVAQFVQFEKDGILIVFFQQTTLDNGWRIRREIKVHPTFRVIVY